MYVCMYVIFNDLMKFEIVDALGFGNSRVWLADEEIDDDEKK